MWTDRRMVSQTILAILVIPCASFLMMYIECDVFHFHGMYLIGIYGNKIKKMMKLVVALHNFVNALKNW